MILVLVSSQRHLTVLAGRAQSSHKLVNTFTESPRRWRLTFFYKKRKHRHDNNKLIKF